jgi:predicted dehydrogenase
MVQGKDQTTKFGRKLRMGMVGGGRDSFIGAVHHKGATMDGDVELVAGALSSTPEKAKESARDLHLPEDRSYTSWQEMLEKESALPKEDRIDFVSIVTPNHLHYPIARAFVQAGFNVVLDKPMVHTTEQASEIQKVIVEYSQSWLLTKLEETGHKQADWRTDPQRAGLVVPLVTSAPTPRI